jgi:hypothetical protein
MCAKGEASNLYMPSEMIRLFLFVGQLAHAALEVRYVGGSEFQCK